MAQNHPGIEKMKNATIGNEKGTTLGGSAQNGSGNLKLGGNIDSNEVIIQNQQFEVIAQHQQSEVIEQHQLFENNIAWNLVQSTAHGTIATQIEEKSE